MCGAKVVGGAIVQLEHACYKDSLRDICVRPYKQLGLIRSIACTAAAGITSTRLVHQIHPMRV